MSCEDDFYDCFAPPKPRRPLVNVRRVVFALAVVGALFATKVVFGAELNKQYLGRVVGCTERADAETLVKLGSSGDMAAANAYLAAEDNTCAAGQIPFVAREKVGPSYKDTEGHPWAIYRADTPQGGIYLVTTAEFTTPS